MRTFMIRLLVLLALWSGLASCDTDEPVLSPPTGLVATPGPGNATMTVEAVNK